MHFITLDSETDFEGWRKAARALVLNDAKPSDVTWMVRGNEPKLFEPAPQINRSNRYKALSTSQPNSSNWRGS